jgi:hypothetical protein
MKNIVPLAAALFRYLPKDRQPHFIKIVDRTRPLPNPFWLAENRVLEMSDGDVRLIDTFETLCRTLNAQTFYFDYNRSTDGSRRLRHCKLARA